jgi:predicted N-acetyltransferase YhbS
LNFVWKNEGIIIMEKLYVDDRNEEQDYTNIDKLAKMCKFNNCLHQNEPGCAVIAAINNGELSADKLKKCFKLLKANEFVNDKKKYKREWKKFTVNLSESSRKSNSNKISEIEILEQETAQLQEEELYMNKEAETLNVIIRKEREDELKIVENSIREAFWNVYKPGCDEHLMVHQLHNSINFIRDLDFVAEIEEQVVGNIVCSKAVVRKEDLQNEIVAIGPIGVIPDYRNRGIGSLLMKKAIDSAREMGYAGMVLYGDPKYYQRFGFVNSETYGITTPDGNNFEAFMVLELGKGMLDGISGKCYEDKAFDINADELIDFDKGFCKKEMK